MNKTLIDASIVGFIVVLVGTITSYVIGKYNTSVLPPICKSWNKNHIMELCLFITGALSYIIIKNLKKSTKLF